MEAKDKSITEFIGDKNSTFKIPAYQRKYKWTYKIEVKTLLEDISQFIKSGSSDYFLGSIVVKKDNSLNSNFVLVDGQQRITTFLLIASAAREVLNDSDDTSLIERVKMLLDTDKNKFKLNRIKDQNVIDRILKDELSSLSDEDKKTSYYLVYEKLIEYFRKNSFEFLRDFYHKGMTRIKIALINLDSEEDEFLVFESINSKGSALTSSDLIKNYVMMSLDNEDLEKEFENDILDNFPENQLSDFYRQLLAISHGALFSKSTKQMYYKFKEKYKREEINNEFIKGLKSDTLIWNYIHNHDFGNKTLPLTKNALLNWYALLHVSVKLNSKNNGKKLEIINEKNIIFVFDELSKATILRALADYGRVESNRTFAKLAFELKNNFENQDVDFLEAFKEIVLNFLKTTSSNAKVPSFEDAIEKIEKNDIYGKHKGVLKSILIALEQKKSKKQISTDKLSIEHILPQNPSEEWNENIVNEAKDLLNTIGNLSITNDNSALGNKLFDHKKKILEDRSYLKINKYIYEKNEWNKETILERQKSILKEIKIYWCL